MEQTKKTILIVEDERAIVDIIKFNLMREGYDTLEALDGETGLELARTKDPDLILLDVMRPKMHGFEICTAVRKRSAVPIIMCTAREEEKDKILGLEIGADDYITKPFSTKELLSRIKANVRRGSGELVGQQKAEAEPIRIRELVIDSDRYTAQIAGRPLELSKLEYDLLTELAANKGKPLSREELLERVWGYNGFYGDIRTVDVTVSRLREKLERDPAKPEYLMTKRGVGYYIAE